LTVPVLILKRKPSTMAGPGKALIVLKNWWVLILFFSTLILPIFMYFIPQWSTTPLPVFLLASLWRLPTAFLRNFSGAAYM
jgi:hypothetical protein